MTDIEAAWLAGFFEGEGNVRFGSITKRPDGRIYGSPVIDICQVNKEPLDKVAKLLPKGKIYGPYQYSSNKQPHYKFCLVGKQNVEEAFNFIEDFLSTRRKTQFLDTFEKYNQSVLSHSKGGRRARKSSKGVE